ncbi:radical SAM protein [Candidatus Sumerlaeota bacterium]|nr:radical SAM protein [Candidatus Sumerlaeota bacterium]
MNADRISGTLAIYEIFQSVQGESTWAGLPCVFVRLAGCNLRCVWCDTDYAFTGGREMSLGEILEAVARLDCPLVEITGGEPLLQKNCPALAQALIDAGYQVLIETSGALSIDVLPAGAIRIMDLKCPGSGECERNDWRNIELLAPRDEVKFVIADRADYEWARGVIREHALQQRCNAVLLSPVFGAIDPRRIAEWMLEDKLPARLQLQIHKIIWDPKQRGV